MGMTDANAEIQHKRLSNKALQLVLLVIFRVWHKGCFSIMPSNKDVRHNACKCFPEQTALGVWRTPCTQLYQS